MWRSWQIRVGLVLAGVIGMLGHGGAAPPGMDGTEADVPPLEERATGSTTTSPAPPAQRQALKLFASPNAFARRGFAHEAAHCTGLQQPVAGSGNNPYSMTIMSNEVAAGAWPDNGYWHLFINTTPDPDQDPVEDHFRVKP